MSNAAALQTKHWCTHLHWEVRVSLVVLEHVPDELVYHGEEGIQGPPSSELHDVVQSLGILECLHHQAPRSKLLGNNVSTVPLNLAGRRREGRGREGEGQRGT